MAAAAAGSASPLLTKDAINIGGHKLPLPVVMAVVGILGLLLVLRARKQGGNVASVGQAPTAAPFTDPTALANLGADNSAAIANISAQLTSLQQAQQQQALPPNSTTAAPGSATQPPPTPAAAPPRPADVPPLPVVIPPLPAPAPAPLPAQPAPLPQPIFAQPIGVLQLHQGDTPQSLATYWSQHGFPGITAAGLAASNTSTPFLPGNVWDIWRAGQGPTTIVGYR